MNINVEGQTLKCYKTQVSKKSSESKTEMVGVMCSASVKKFIEDMAEKEDRSLSYVAGNFLLRGIAAYNRDGLLKEPEDKGNATTTPDVITSSEPDTVLAIERKAHKSSPKQKKRTNG